jgi:hypothetical protein
MRIKNPEFQQSNSIDYTNWLMEFDKEDDYDPAELAKIFEKCNV